MKQFKIYYWNGHQTTFEVREALRKVEAVIGFLKDSDNEIEITKIETL